MTFSTIANFFKPVVYGMSVYRTYVNGRALTVGWKQQRGLCALDDIANISMLVITSQKNLEAVTGKPLTSYFGKVSYLSYIFIPGLHYLSYHLEESVDNQKLKDWVDFTCLHMNDIILIVSAVHSLAAFQIGFNRISNGVFLVFCAWAVLEQGVFWTKPQENRGPLTTAMNGALFRFYSPYVKKGMDRINPFLNFFCRGRLGKIEATMSFFPSGFFNRFLKITEQPNDTDHTYLPRWIVGQRVAPGIQIFTPFKIEDQFPKNTLGELKEELQTHLDSDSSHYMKMIGKGTLGLTHKEMIVELTSKLQHYVDTRSTDGEKKQKEGYLKNIFGVINADWEKNRSILIDHYDDFLCETAMGSTLQQIAFEYYLDHQPKKGDDFLKNYIEVAIKLILQSERDLIFEGIKLNRAQIFSNLRKQSIQRREHGWTQIKENNYTLKTIKDWAVTFFLEAICVVCEYSLKMNTNRHMNNLLMYNIGQSFGLSHYAEAKQEIEKNQSEISNAIISLSNILTIAIMHKTFQDIWLTDLINAINDEGDTRLDFAHIREYVVKGYPQVEEEALELELKKAPPLKQDYSNIEEVETSGKAYVSAKKAFLEKYLPQVLYDLKLAYVG